MKRFTTVLIMAMSAWSLLCGQSKANAEPTNLTITSVIYVPYSEFTKLRDDFKALLDSSGKIADSSLAVRYAHEIHNHDAAYKHANQTILDGLTQAKLDHDTTTTNPHNVTQAQVGLGYVTNDAQIPLSQKGVANGVATLDANSNLVFDGGSAKIYGNGANTLSYSFGGNCKSVLTDIGGTCVP